VSSDASIQRQEESKKVLRSLDRLIFFLAKRERGEMQPRSREPAQQATQPARRKTFGAAFTFGTPLLLNSQPQQPALLPPPRATAAAAAAAAHASVPAPSSSRHGSAASAYHRRGEGTTAVAAAAAAAAGGAGSRRPVGGYGVTPPLAAYPTPPLMRTVGGCTS
jgi:hypothetical protein